ncbi:hypothetical protein PSTG_02755 [Puccinia striiformis f. sp. tritici PST-78]|uniref:Myb/SANT-like domain-containing protein n=1 Tax=Puccinia striiformis f. sp. tritici PST-78 TaxID=1165861 RepID=A0A0L0VXY8_9BASI|nr:hypothetical protein PSTG_02755 [Puccinia striiformis f. sp. tritici PST-78]
MNLDPDLFAALMQPLPKQTTESSPAPPMDPIESTPAVAPAPQEAEAEGEEDNDDGKKGNHTWTPNQETALIQYILDQKALGKGTDNANLKAKGWTQVSRDMYSEFKIEFTNIQLKNQKGYMQKLYVDQDFLRSQSGFGWDKTAKMVTTNPEVWNTLIQAHPNRKFATLLATPFEWYVLGKRLFDKNIATGVVLCFGFKYQKKNVHILGYRIQLVEVISNSRAKQVVYREV